MPLTLPLSSPICHRGGFRKIVLWVAILSLGLGMVDYYFGILIPIRHKQLQIGGKNVSGNWSDLYPRWLGARELLWHGRNPYSAEVTAGIQRGFYGGQIGQFDAHNPTDPQGFAYPIYIVFLLAPLLPFPFEVVRPVFSGILLVMTPASFLLWMRALGVRLQAGTALPVLTLAMTSYAVLDGLQLQQITLLVAFLMSASVAALAAGSWRLAGVLLSMATVKPQLAVFLVGFLLLWSLGEWRSRKRFALATGGSMAALLIGAEVVLPGWFGWWRNAAYGYLGHHKPALLAGVLGPTPAAVVGTIAVLAFAGLCWRLRKEPAGSQRFNWMLVAAMALTALFWPNAGSSYYNQVVLFPACVWLFTSAPSLRLSLFARSLWWLAVSVLLLQWMVAILPILATQVFGRRFERESTVIIAGPEFLVFCFPLILSLFILSAAPGLRRQQNPPEASA